MATVSEISTCVPIIPLGQQGFQVSAQGLGCAGMSGFYGPPKPDEEMISLVRSAVSRGVTFLDTSDSYGPHINEILIGKAIKGIRDKVQLATKFAVSYVDGHVKIRGDPAYVRAACEASLKRLDVDYIDLYYQHRVDTTVPIEITMGELKKLVKEGKIKYVGLSEPSADTIRRAHAVHPITAVQIEWSLWSRDVEEQVIPTCRELGIGIVAFSPLGRGFLASGLKMVESLTQTDIRKDFPRFQAENLEKNKIAYERVCEMSSNKTCSPAQIALAWVHTRGKDVVPIPGTTKLQNLEQNLKALEIKLTDAELEEIENAVSSVVSGERYPEEIMHTIWRYSDTPPLASWKPV